MTSKAERTQQFILEKAESIFMEEGFSKVTMTHIVEACGISRGGLYRYFKSTNDIFNSILKMNQPEESKGLEEGIGKMASATDLLAQFLQHEKQNLLREHASLTTAVYEFYFEHKHELEQNWLQQQFNHAEEILATLVQYGIDQGEFQSNNPYEVARQFLFIMEGLRVSAEVMDLDEKIIDGQFDLLKKQIAKREEQ